MRTAERTLSAARTGIILVLFLSSWAACGHAFNEREDFDLIRRAYDDKLFLLVQERAERFLANPAYDQQGTIAQKIRRFVIGGAVERGDWSRALEEIRRFEGMYQDSDLAPAIELYKAQVLYECYVREGKPLPEGYGERPSAIIERISDRLEEDPAADKELLGSTALALYIQGMDYFTMGTRDAYLKASETLGNLVQNHHQFPMLKEAQYFRAQSYYFLDEYETALRMFSTLILESQKSKKLAEYHYWKGQCLFDLGRLDEAMKNFQIALTQDPGPETLANIYYNQGWLYSCQGRNDEAKEVLRKLFSPSLVGASARYRHSAHFKLASMLLQENLCQESLSEILQVMDSPVLKDKASLVAAQIYYRLGQLDRACEQVETAAKSPQKALALDAEKMRALIYSEQGRYDEAMGILEGLLQTPVSLDYKMDVLLQTAEVLFAKKEYYRAHDIYRNLLLENNPGMAPGLYYKMAKCKKEMNPLIESLMERDRIGALSDAEIEMSQEMKAQRAKLEFVFSELWRMASDEGARMSRELLLKRMSDITGKSQPEAQATVLELMRKDNPRIKPSEEEISNKHFHLLVSYFVGLYNHRKLPSYKEAIESFRELAEPCPSLQLAEIRNYLMRIIEMKSESPFLPLAYAEMANIELSQNNNDTAIVYLQRAAERTAVPEDRALYLYQTAQTRYRMLKAVDEMSRPELMKAALADLDRLEGIQPDKMRERTASLKFSCHMALRDHAKAEAVLLEALRCGLPAEAMNRIEKELIQFYQDLGQPLKAAQQKLRFAARISAADPVAAQQLSFEAADLYLVQNDVDWVRKGEDLMISLSSLTPVSEWTFRASLKTMNVHHSRGSGEQAGKTAAALAEPAGMNAELLMEKEMAFAFHELALGRPNDALARFQKVMEDAPSGSAIKALAHLKHARLLKASDPEAAADCLYKFYYLYPEHALREEALMDSCRLRIEGLKARTGDKEKPDELKRRKDEIRILISKLSVDKDRKKLLDDLDAGGGEAATKQTR